MSLDRGAGRKGKDRSGIGSAMLASGVVYLSLSLLIPSSAFSTEIQYGAITIIETFGSEDGSPGERTFWSSLLVRLDNHRGNEFYCKERREEALTERAEDSLWAACIVKLVEKTPTVKLGDLPYAVYWEYVVLTLFGKSGWDIYAVEKETTALKDVYSTTRTFRVKRYVSTQPEK